MLLTSFAFTWLFFAEYLSPFRRVHIPFDLEGYHYPLVDYAFQSLKQGRFPEWDWSIYSGVSFVGNMQAALFYPPTWLLFLANAGREHVSYVSLETFVILHVWIGCLLCFYWLQSREMTTFASVAGAQVFAFSGYVCLQLQHQGLITAFAWFPLAAWGIDDASRRRSWWPSWKLVVASALVFFTGYPPMWIVFAVAITAYAIGSLERWTMVATVLGLAGSLLLAMVQILPAWEAARFMQLDESYGAGLKDLPFFLSYVLPNYFNFGLNVPVGTNPGMEYLYLGAPGLAGILLAIRFGVFRKALPALMALSASLILLTNPFDVVWTVIQHVTLLASLVRSWYFLAGVAFGAALLAAEGLDELLKRQPVREVASVWPAVVAVVLAVWPCWELRLWFRGSFSYGWSSAWVTLATLVLFFLAILCMRGVKARERAILSALLIFSAGIDYKVFGTSKRFNASTLAAPSFRRDQYPNMDQSAYREILSHPQYRVLLDQTAPFTGTVRHWGVTTPQGFDPLLTIQYRAALGSAAKFRTDREFDIDPADEASLHLLGVRYFITAEQGPSYKALISNPKFRLLGARDLYFKTFEYSDAMPPFGMDGGQLEARVWNPEHRSFRVTSAAGGTLHLTEQRMPGWSATIDGVPAKLESWHDAFQAVNVPAGDHVVDFRFSSSGLKAGALISLVSIAGLVWAARATTRRSS